MGKGALEGDAHGGEDFFEAALEVGLGGPAGLVGGEAEVSAGHQVDGGWVAHAGTWTSLKRDWRLASNHCWKARMAELRAGEEGQDVVGGSETAPARR